MITKTISILCSMVGTAASIIPWNTILGVQRWLALHDPYAHHQGERQLEIKVLLITSDTEDYLWATPRGLLKRSSDIYWAYVGDYTEGLSVRIIISSILGSNWKVKGYLEILD